ncbi:hypothetical protein [Thalassospira povalilytica]|uniref:hypothetical protein n=1 Tax=Thalassospira povalilytica TaxID=732237 RepID=UPI003AA8E825
MTTGKDNRDHPESSDQPSPASDPSSDDEKLEHLATRFLALWREQVAATADGADAASAIGRLYASLGADTTRMGEGFEAWGKLIGQMAMGQQADPKSAHPFAGAMGAGASNPLMAMMDQMAKAARDLPSQPFGGAMPFPPGVAEMAGMSGMAGMTGMKPDAATAPGSDKKAADHKTDTADTTDKADAGTGGTTGTTGKASPAAAAPPAGATPDDRPSPAKSRKKTTAAKNAAKGQGKNDQSDATKTASAKKAKSETGRATAASDAHGSRDDELAQLARRIADLSETIAALEAGTEGTGGKPPSRD